MQIHVLGPLRVLREGTEVELGPFRQRSVLAALLLRPGSPVPSDEIIDFVWGNDSPVSAVNIVQTYVRRLRDILEPGRVPRSRNGWLTTVGVGCYSAKVEDGDLDLLRFRTLVQRAAGASADDALDLLIEALDLWRGPCLSDLGPKWQAHPWVRAINRERGDAILAAADSARQCGRTAELLPRLRALAADEPLNEPLHAQLLLALAESGAEAEAANCYADISRRLSDELGVDPSPPLRDAYQQVINRIVRLQRPVPDIEPVRWRGPAPVLGGLVGRADDLRELAKLAPERRLVTLTGPGGVGKTALALAVADRLAVRYPDGVAVLELGSLPAERSDGQGEENLEVVADMLCALLGVPVGASGAMEALTRAVRGQAMLVVVDNAEHTVTAASRLAEQLLQAAERINVLITSRQPLGVADETIWEVEPLAVPPDHGAADPLDFPAIQLYLRRAAENCPTLNLTDSLSVVVELCDHLAGLPLGIELAAGRLRSMSPETLLQRIAGQPGVLTRAGTQGLPHQRSLATTVQWSIDLLEPEQRLLLSRLAVFAGRFELDAAERIAGFAPLTPEQVTALFPGLIDHSLVQVTRDEEYHYRILSPIRECCLSDAAAADLVTTRDRHLEFYRDLGEEQESGRGTALGRLRTQSADVSAAVEWGLRPDAEHAAVVNSIALLTACRPLWDHLAGHMKALDRWTRLGLTHLTRLPPPLQRRMLHWAGRLAYIGARFQEARAHLSQALAMLDVGSPSGMLQRADIMLGLAAISDALLDRDAVERARDAVDAARLSGDPAHMVTAHAGAAVILAWRDHGAEAQMLVDQAFATSGADERLLGLCHWYQAQIALRTGRLLEANRSAGRVLTLHFEPTQDAISSALLCLAWTRVLAGMPEEAVEPLDKAREVCENSQRSFLLPEIAELAAHVSWRRDDSLQAGRILADAILPALERGNLAVVLRMLHLAAALLVETGDRGAAELVSTVAGIRQATGYGTWPFTEEECLGWESTLGVVTRDPPAEGDVRGLIDRCADIAVRGLPATSLPTDR
ncbi:BTAD domain-containing putative transcriptional regulator [Nonomuraea angiospora]|uniref:BTAD domain-containing putative transcriptional regulator n=1 Tax=Nonomuraea angiospora TaxID=46172 RepID=UPI00344CC86F